MGSNVEHFYRAIKLEYKICFLFTSFVSTFLNLNVSVVKYLKLIGRSA